MPARSSVRLLPPAVLEELNRRLVSNGFSDYRGLALWLADQGFEISKTALHRHGMALEEEFDQAMADVRRTRELARAVAEENDDGGELLAATSGILQEQLLRTAIALRQADEDPVEAAKGLSQLARAHADVGRFGISLRKWQDEVRAKCAAAAEACEREARRGGLTPEAVNMIRAQILGITA